MQTAQSGFDDGIGDITGSVVELGTRVETMLTDTLKAIRIGDSSVLNGVVSSEAEVISLHHYVDREAVNTLTVSPNTYAQTRHILSSVKVAHDLERIGDLTENTARNISQLNTDHIFDLVPGVDRMGRQVKQQLSDIIDAYSHENATKALRVWISQEDLEALYKALFNDYIVQNSQNPGRSETYTNLIFIAKNLQRIGARVTSMAESVYFSVKGSPLIEDEAIKKHLPILIN